MTAGSDAEEVPLDHVRLVVLDAGKVIPDVAAFSDFVCAPVEKLDEIGINARNGADAAKHAAIASSSCAAIAATRRSEIELGIGRSSEKSRSSTWGTRRGIFLPMPRTWSRPLGRPAEDAGGEGWLRTPDPETRETPSA
jgi:hypothetical protein